MSFQLNTNAFLSVQISWKFSISAPKVFLSFMSSVFFQTTLKNNINTTIKNKNPHFTRLHLILLDKCGTSWVRNTWLAWLAFAVRKEPEWVLCGLFCVCSFYKKKCSPCHAKMGMFMCPSIRLSFGWAYKGRTTRRREWFDCLSIWNKNAYIKNHRSDIQSDGCKLSLNLCERHMQFINNSPRQL